MAKEAHLKAATEQDNAAKAHRIAAEQDMSNKQGTLDQSKKAHECSTKAHQYSTEAHKKSEQSPVAV